MECILMLCPNTGKRAPLTQESVSNFQTDSLKYHKLGNIAKNSIASCPLGPAALTGCVVRRDTSCVSPPQSRVSPTGILWHTLSLQAEASEALHSHSHQ